MAEQGGYSPKALCNRFGSNLVLFKNGLSMNGADLGSTCQLFFDNLSTMLGAVFALQGLTNVGDISVSTETMDNYVWKKIVPGVGVTLVVGNVYYTWQAIRMSIRTGRQYTAQPYGLNTPGAFAFIYNIIYAVFFSEGGGDAAFIKGYNVALAANFVTGLISLFLGLFGQLLLKVIPPAALLVPIAGLGFAFLGLEQVTNSIAAPIVGYNCILWVFLGWYSGVRIGYKGYRVPQAVQVIGIGIILGWATGLNSPEATKQAAQLVQWWGPTWTASEMFEDFSSIKDFLGIIIPLGISAAATSLMCLVSAKEAGDPFPVRESLIFDGIGTCIASFFGSPFGTVIYIGHPAYKRTGAKVGYSLLNGTIFWIMSWFGVLALIKSIVNQACIGPIVFFVALQICEESLNFMPARHYAAFIIGLFSAVYDWAVNISNRSPLADPDETYNTNSPGGSAWAGVLAWKRGSLLVSMVWVAMIVNVIDRQWKIATIWAVVAALFALVGVIHVPEAGFSSLNTPFWEQCPTADTCWNFAYQWMFVVAYIMMGATFLIIWYASQYDTQIGEPLDDESRHAFEDWFKDQYTYVDAEGNYRDSRDNSIIKDPHAKTLDATKQEVDGSDDAEAVGVEKESSPMQDEAEEEDA